MTQESAIEYYIECSKCGRIWLITDEDFEEKPWPHIECPKCEEWIEKPRNISIH